MKGEEVEFEIGLLGDLMGLGDKDLELDPSVKDFFDGIETLVFNLEGFIDPKKRPVLISQTTRHFRHLEHLKQQFPSIKILAGVANNHIDDLSPEKLAACLTGVEERGIEVFGTKDHCSVDLRPGLKLTGLTYWKAAQKSFAATLDDLRPGNEQEILFLHHGTEFQLEPSADDIERLKDLPSNIIALICHHTHFPQRIEIG